jgi:hypothetical protein
VNAHVICLVKLGEVCAEAGEEAAMASREKWKRNNTLSAEIYGVWKMIRPKQHLLSKANYKNNEKQKQQANPKQSTSMWPYSRQWPHRIAARIEAGQQVTEGGVNGGRASVSRRRTVLHQGAAHLWYRTEALRTAMNRDNIRQRSKG